MHLQRVEELENEVRRLRKELESEKVRIARQAPSYLLMVSELRPTNIFKYDVYCLGDVDCTNMKMDKIEIASGLDLGKFCLFLGRNYVIINVIDLRIFRCIELIKLYYLVIIY